MNSSATTTAFPSSLLLRRRIDNLFLFTSSPSFLRPRHSKLLHLSASLSHLTWLSPNHNNHDDYNGWAIVESPPLQTKTKKGVVGSSLAVLLANVAYFSLSRKGFRLQFGSPLNALHDILNRTETKSGDGKTVEFVETDVSTVPDSESVSDDKPAIFASCSEDKLEHVIISVAVDSTQQEALSVLKKLKIIEDDVKADELCSRREYARWLVRLNSLLERNPKHSIVPSKSLSRSVIAAFDDVNVGDPDCVYPSPCRGWCHSQHAIRKNFWF